MKKLVTLFVVVLIVGSVRGQDLKIKELKNSIGFSLPEFINDGIGISYERGIVQAFAVGSNFRYFYLKEIAMKKKGFVEELYVKMDVLKRTVLHKEIVLYSTLFGQYRRFELMYAHRKYVEDGNSNYTYVKDQKTIEGYGMGFTWGLKISIQKRFYINIFGGSQIRFTKDEVQCGTNHVYNSLDFNGVSPRAGIDFGVRF
jgi:hypothetical protein